MGGAELVSVTLSGARIDYTDANFTHSTAAGALQNAPVPKGTLLVVDRSPAPFPIAPIGVTLIVSYGTTRDGCSIYEATGDEEEEE